MTDIDDYIEQHIDAESSWLAATDRDTHARLVNPRMCSGHIQGRLLKMLVRMARPERILELGTFSGYSALALAEALPEGGELHTVEIDDEMEDFIRRHLAQAPAEIAGKINLHFGDALTVCDTIEGDFDMIFIDADKRSYADYYRRFLPRLRPGGFMIADNTLWDGHVVETSGPRDRQTRGIMEFNDLVAADPSVEKVIVPLRDGLTIIYKKQTSDSPAETSAHPGC